jgi:hypothetical protein
MDPPWLVLAGTVYASQKLDPFSAAGSCFLNSIELSNTAGHSVIKSTSYSDWNAFLGANGIHVFRCAGPWVKRAFDDSALALKARAEALHAGG